MLNTYETMQQLVAKKLATVKTDGIFDTFKYHHNVMYDNLWQKYPELLEVRGHVYDNRNGKLVQAAPRKTFNYLENDNWKNVPLDTPVRMYKKFNGFMAAATIYEGQLVVSTTGTTNSDYAKLARQLIVADPLFVSTWIGEHETCLFEVVHESDPHIVNEREGLHILGWRYHDDAVWVPSAYSAKVKHATLREALAFVTMDRGEGFMLYDAVGNCCKLKTPYYTGKKILMRMTEKNVRAMYMGLLPARLPEMCYDSVHAVKNTYNVDDWINMDAQTRRKVLENYV